MAALTIFEKKLKVLKRVSVADNLNFGKLFRAGELSVISLEVPDKYSFPLPHWDTKEEDKHNLLIEHLKVNWEEDKGSDGYPKDNVWSTYQGCTDVTLIYTEDGYIHLKVVVYEGDSFDSYRGAKRFSVVFMVENLTSVRKAYKESVDITMYSYAKNIRRLEIVQEEDDKINTILKGLVDNA